MLSRVAERLYWMSRYLERTEYTARIVSASNHLLMDLRQLLVIDLPFTTLGH